MWNSMMWMWPAGNSLISAREKLQAKVNLKFKKKQVSKLWAFSGKWIKGAALMDEPIPFLAHFTAPGKTHLLTQRTQCSVEINTCFEYWKQYCTCPKYRPQISFEKDFNFSDAAARPVYLHVLMFAVISLCVCQTTGNSQPDDISWSRARRLWTRCLRLAHIQIQCQVIREMQPVSVMTTCCLTQLHTDTIEESD